MSVHRVTLDDRCWLKRTPEGGLKGCAVGALFYTTYDDVPLDAGDVIEWATDYTGSRRYVQGFDVGFHHFTPIENPTDDYALGHADGQHTRLLFDEPGIGRPVLWCWRGAEESK